MSDASALDPPTIAETAHAAPVDAASLRRRAERILASGALIAVVVLIGAGWYAQQGIFSLMTTDGDGNVTPNWASATIEATVSMTQQAAGLLLAAAVLLATLSLLRQPPVHPTTPQAEPDQAAPVVPVGGTTTAADAVVREALAAATSLPSAPEPPLAPLAAPAHEPSEPADFAAFRRPNDES